MKKILAVLAVAGMAVPALAATDYFPLAGAGSFDTYYDSATPANTEGYSNGGNASSPRLGYAKQGLGWMSWDSKDSSGVEKVSVGDVSGQTMASFLAANGVTASTPGVTATLYVNVTGGTGTYAIESLRCGNTGVLQADNNMQVGGKFSNTTGAQITGSTQAWAWQAGAGPWTAVGKLNADDTPWVAVGTTSSHYGYNDQTFTTNQFTAGQQVKWTTNGSIFYGYSSSMAGNGGQPWALNAILGGDWSQGGRNMSLAQQAGQVVNNDGAGNAVLMNVASTTATAPRPASAAGKWVAVPISLDLLASISNEGASSNDKGIVLDNWFAGTTSSSANPAFYGPNQNNGANSFLVITTPEPATLCLLALGGLALLRRRHA